MSRTIKFRAWIKRKNELIYLRGFRYSGNEKIKITFADEDKDDCTYTFLNKDVILEQFTGLHDKNGVEVYEGDVIRIPDNATHCDGVVVYSEKYASFVLQNTNSIKFENENIGDYENVEVIGDIHERSEDNDK